MRRTHSQENSVHKIPSIPEASGDFVQVRNNMIEVHNKDIETLREYLHETPDRQANYIRNDGSINIEEYDVIRKIFK